MSFLLKVVSIKSVLAAFFLTFTGFYVSAQTQETSAPVVNPAVADSVNRSAAVVMAGSLDEVITDLLKAKVPVDKAEIGKYIAEVMSGKDLGIDRVSANMYIDNMIRANSPYLPDTLSIESQKEYLESAAALPGAIKEPSGLIFVVITEGEGAYPTLNDKVKINYVAKLSDGTVFDNTEGETVTFDVAKVIPGFSEGLQLMKPGGTYRVIIPAELGYGQYGIPGIIPANAVLDFTVTLEKVL